MKLPRIVGDCPDDVTCPTTYASDRGAIIVQEYTLSTEDLNEISLADREDTVEASVSPLKETARAHCG